MSDIQMIQHLYQFTLSSEYVERHDEKENKLTLYI